MKPLRLIDTGLAEAAWNLAVTGALAELHQSGQIGDTLRLHRYRRSVLLGCHTPVSAADAAACARLDAQVVRRISGGGAVAMEPGILAWELLITRAPSDAPEDISARICTHVADALAAFGVNAHFRAPGDIVAKGQKIGGTAGFFDGLSMLHQGSLLVMPDVAEMAALMGQQALPVTTIAILAGHAPDMQAVSAAVASAIFTGLNREGREDRLSVAETGLARAMTPGEVPV